MSFSGLSSIELMQRAVADGYTRHVADGYT
jgi:hypothetical protein